MRLRKLQVATLLIPNTDSDPTGEKANMVLQNWQGLHPEADVLFANTIYDNSNHGFYVCHVFYHAIDSEKVKEIFDEATAGLETTADAVGKTCPVGKQLGTEAVNAVTEKLKGMAEKLTGTEGKSEDKPEDKPADVSTGNKPEDKPSDPPAAPATPKK